MIKLLKKLFSKQKKIKIIKNSNDEKYKDLIWYDQYINNMFNVKFETSKYYYVMYDNDNELGQVRKEDCILL